MPQKAVVLQIPSDSYLLDSASTELCKFMALATGIKVSYNQNTVAHFYRFRFDHLQLIVKL